MSTIPNTPQPTATCKTCGGSPGNHKPSMFDPQGIGDPGHKMPQPTVDEEVEALFKGYTAHRVGSHSDDWGGDSDKPCFCDLKRDISALITSERTKAYDEASARMQKTIDSFEATAGNMEKKNMRDFAKNHRAVRLGWIQAQRVVDGLRDAEQRKALATLRTSGGVK